MNLKCSTYWFGYWVGYHRQTKRAFRTVRQYPPRWR